MSYHSLGLTPENFDRKTVPQLDSSKIEMLWHDSWYDGPLTGVIEYEGQKHYFDLYCPDNDTIGYDYVTILLTENEYDKLRTEHEKWEVALKGYYDKFNGRLAWDDPQVIAYWEATGFGKRDEDTFAEDNPWYRRERVTGYFCEAGTTKQQFSAIKVTDKDGKLL